eukprot:COSAG01_NODE_42405_length_440_cov_1.049853_1_plen_61_part_01
MPPPGNSAIVAQTVTNDRSGVPASMRSQNRVATPDSVRATAQATADGFNLTAQAQAQAQAQ